MYCFSCDSKLSATKSAFYCDLCEYKNYLIYFKGELIVWQILNNNNCIESYRIQNVTYYWEDPAIIIPEFFNLPKTKEEAIILFNDFKKLALY